MSTTVHTTNKKPFEICDGVILVLGIAFMLYPVYAVVMGSPVVRLLAIMQGLQADVPVFLRVFFSLAPYSLPMYSLLFFFGVLTIVSMHAARHERAWAVRVVRIVCWIIGVTTVCVFGFWLITARAVPDAASLLFSVQGPQELAVVLGVGLVVVVFVLSSLGMCLKRMKRRLEEG